MKRCAWVNEKNPLYVKYHDEEWGVPLHDDRSLFELLILEGFQAGLSWECVLRADSGIIRNQSKIRAAVGNARAFLDIVREKGSFDSYIWSCTGGRQIREPYNLRTSSPLSDAVSADLRRRGMKYVGTTILYSFLQAIGVINAHGEECDMKDAGIRTK